MSVPRFSVNNPVLANMVMLVTLVGGALFACTLVREMLPESRPQKLTIASVYPGVQPPEIERSVTVKIEEAIRDISGIEKVESAVSEGLSITTVTLLSEIDDVDAVLQDVRNEIDSLPDLPDDIERTTVQKLEPQLPCISVALYGDVQEASLKRAGHQLRDELLLLPGVSEVHNSGVRDDEISVEVRPTRLLEFDITLDEVAAAIRQSNLDVSGGTLKGDRTTIAVRTLGEKRRGHELETIVVRSRPDGRKIHLSDVAIVRDGFVESDLESYFNGFPGVNCTVYKTAAQDAIQIAGLVKAWVAGRQGEKYDPYGWDDIATLPWYSRPVASIGAAISWSVDRISGRPNPMTYYEQARGLPFDDSLEVAVHTDLARFVEGRLDLMLRNGRAGLLLVLASLILFLNWRVAFWSAIGLPVSFLGTFIAMWAFGATINLMTLFGLIIVLGIIVDDAIIIGENIYRHVEEGLSAREAAIRGAEEVQKPVVIAIMTTVAAFGPLLFIQGEIGDLIRQLPIVVVAALSVSLVEALLILPAHLSHLPPARTTQRSGEPGRLAAAAAKVQQGLFRAIHDVYLKVLELCLRWRYVTVSVATGTLLTALGLVEGGIVDWQFLQKMDSETIICSFEMPVGTPAPLVRERLLVLTNHAVALPEISNVQMIVARQYDMGGSGATGATDQSHLGQLVIELKAADAREAEGLRSSTDVLLELREVSQSLTGVNSVTWEEMLGAPGGRDIVIHVSGGSFDQLLEVAELLKQRLAGFDAVYDLDDNVDLGRREVRLRMREAARPTGITDNVLGRHVRAAVYGTEARRITRRREDVRIMVRYPEDFRTNLFNVESMWVPTGSTGNRGWVPLHEVAEVTEADSYSTLHRIHQKRSVSVLADVDDERTSTSQVLTNLREAFEKEIHPLHPDVRIEFAGSYEEQTKAFASLKLAFPMALLLIYMLLAGMFRSYVQPLVVMSAIPFGIQGAIVGHWITGNPFTILSAIGLVALSGILVNDSLIIVDFINRRVRSGMEPLQASLDGARLRLRAILLTTLTTAAGLTPIMFERSFQAKFLIPMAVTLTFGLLFATALTLIIVPSINLIMFDVRRLFGFQEEQEETSASSPIDDDSP